MYNRYIRNDRGVYTRVPDEESGGEQERSRPEGPPPSPPPPSSPLGGIDGISHFLRRLLDRLHLENVDTGDLLLLLLLFLLFEEDADEELLFALGLLLIL